MAIIKCPECNNNISDKASSCVHCGCPILNEEDICVTVKALKRSSISTPSLTIYLYTDTNEFIEEVLEGHTITFKANKSINVYASLVKPSGKNKIIRSTSSCVNVLPNQNIKLQIGYKIGFASVSLTLTEVKSFDM